MQKLKFNTKSFTKTLIKVTLLPLKALANLLLQNITFVGYKSIINVRWVHFLSFLQIVRIQKIIISLFKSI